MSHKYRLTGSSHSNCDFMKTVTHTMHGMKLDTDWYSMQSMEQDGCPSYKLKQSGSDPGEGIMT